MHPLLFVAGLAAAALPTEAEIFGGVFARLDGDLDGTLSQAEYARFDVEAHFATMDRDRSLSVDQDEFVAWVGTTQPRPTSARPSARPGQDGPPKVLVEAADGGRIVAVEGNAGLTLTIGSSEPASLNDTGEGADIAAGDGVYSGFAPGPRSGRGNGPGNTGPGNRPGNGPGDWPGNGPRPGNGPGQGQPGGMPAAERMESAQDAPPTPSAPTSGSWHDGWPLYAGILGVGVVTGASIERRRRPRGRG